MATEKQHVRSRDVRVAQTPNSQPVTFLDMEEAVSRACALLECMGGYIAAHREDDWGDPHSGTAACGYIHLTHETSAELRRCHAAIEADYLRMKDAV
jgi:hypothetical protein